jgi:Rrf2 family protein
LRETLRISARADYAIRAAAGIAAMPADALVTADTLSAAHDIPLRFLLAILSKLRQAGIVESRRGPGGGYRLARPSSALTLAEIIEAVDVAPTRQPWPHTSECAEESPTTVRVHALWWSLRTSLQDTLEHTTIADVLAGEQPTLSR